MRTFGVSWHGWRWGREVDLFLTYQRTGFVSVFWGRLEIGDALAAIREKLRQAVAAMPNSDNHRRDGL